MDGYTLGLALLYAAFPIGMAIWAYAGYLLFRKEK